MTTKLGPGEYRIGREPGADCYNTGLAAMIVRSKDCRYWIVGPELVATEAYHSLRRGATREVALAAAGTTRWLALRIVTTPEAAWTAYNVANLRAKELVLADQATSRQEQSALDVALR